MGRLPATSRIGVIDRRTNERRSEGIDIDATDLARVRALARWYCLTPRHLIALEEPYHSWHPDAATAGTLSVEERSRLIGRRAEAARRRLGKMARVEAVGGDGPLVVGNLTLDRQLIYSATRFGGRAADTSWDNLGPINLYSIEHALLGAEVGIQLQGLMGTTGARVFSQRELDTGHDASGEDLPQKYRSGFLRRGGEVTEKAPDLVLSTSSGDKYIAVEVERDTNRPMDVYKAKLSAYEGNLDIAATWYVCEHPATAKRVLRAAEEFPGANVRVMLLRDLGNGLREADIQYLHLPEHERASQLQLIAEDLQKVAR
ncbi:hypothetical protein GCM10025867_46690 (plasmid) [Frondihabitans sucicola]|uniref:XcyI family restriction endonuclease n=1 Tax=Frondihabitans sucicola TaxID=1268041 RepID=A0ABN6Y8V8_9MICO|nr:hypothetical protein [Frondihabitans sucicola]BDZ52428.1 hypothetical protein GCM10025867_46690 [Frondihabitans sucicola]